MKRRDFLQAVGAGAAAAHVAGCSGAKGFKIADSYQPSGAMPMRTLGKTGMNVSRLGFGSHLSQELVARPKVRDRMIRLGYENGINIFDVYNRDEYKQYIPMSESIRDFRKDIHISLYAINGVEHIQRDIDYALKTFKTDYIDLYRFRPVNDESVRIMERNKQAGNIRALGIAGHEATDILEKLEIYGDIYDYVLLIYNFHHNKLLPEARFPENDYSKLLPTCRELNLGVLVMKPMGSDNMIALAKKKGFFKDSKANIAQAALKFTFRRNELDTTFTAMNSIEEVITNLEAAYHPELTSYEEQRLAELSNIAMEEQRAYLPPHYKWLENWASRTV